MGQNIDTLLSVKIVFSHNQLHFIRDKRVACVQDKACRIASYGTTWLIQCLIQSEARWYIYKLPPPLVSISPDGWFQIADWHELHDGSRPLKSARRHFYFVKLTSNIKAN